MLMVTAIYECLAKTKASRMCCGCGVPSFNSSFCSSVDPFKKNTLSNLPLSIEQQRVSSNNMPNSVCFKSSAICAKTSHTRSLKLIVVNCQIVKNHGY